MSLELWRLWLGSYTLATSLVYIARWKENNKEKQKDMEGGEMREWKRKEKGKEKRKEKKEQDNEESKEKRINPKKVFCDCPKYHCEHSKYSVPFKKSRPLYLTSFWSLKT